MHKLANHFSSRNCGKLTSFLTMLLVFATLSSSTLQAATATIVNDIIKLAFFFCPATAA
jgi:hypothetical protein